MKHLQLLIILFIAYVSSIQARFNPVYIGEIYKNVTNGTVIKILATIKIKRQKTFVPYIIYEHVQTKKIRIKPESSFSQLVEHDGVLVTRYEPQFYDDYNT